MVAGLCHAALHALAHRPQKTHDIVLRILDRFIPAITPPHNHEEAYFAAMAVLVPGQYVELTMRHMAQAGPDMLTCGLALFKYCLSDAAARERLCCPRTMDQLMNWLVKWLPQVRRVVTLNPVRSL